MDKEIAFFQNILLDSIEKYIINYVYSKNFTINYKFKMNELLLYSKMNFIDRILTKESCIQYTGDYLFEAKGDSLIDIIDHADLPEKISYICDLLKEKLQSEIILEDKHIPNILQLIHEWDL
jgi:hypothetical protein